MVITDFLYFKIKALRRDWEFRQPKNEQFLMAITYFFNLKSKRFTVIGKPGGQKIRNSLYWLRISLNLKLKRFAAIGVRGNQKNCNSL